MSEPEYVMALPASREGQDKLFQQMQAIVATVAENIEPHRQAMNEALAKAEQYRLAAIAHQEKISQIRKDAIAHLPGATWLGFKKHMGIIARLRGGN